MKLKYILAISPILFFSLFHFQTLNAQQAQYRVIPLPQSIEETNADPFRLSATTSIQCGVNDEMMRRNAAFLSEYVEKATGWKLSLNEAKKRFKAWNEVAVLATSTNPENPLDWSYAEPMPVSYLTKSNFSSPK